MSICTFLINLDKATARLTSAATQLDAADIPFTRIPAVDGRHLTADQTAQYSQTHAFRRYGRSLSQGELGCFLSHHLCLSKFLETDAQHCLVLEDDLTIDPDFSDVLARLISFLDDDYPVDWFIVNLGNSPKKLSSPVATLETNTLMAAHHFPVLTTGLLWSRAGAIAFLNAYLPISAPIDQFLKDWCTKLGGGIGLALTDPPIKTIEAESQIAYSRDLESARRGLKNVIYFLRKQKRHGLNNLYAKQAMKSFDKTFANRDTP